MAMTGTVKFFNGERGYGFIKPDEGSHDVFVHISALERAGLKDLREGQRLTFDVEPDKKGQRPQGGQPRDFFLNRSSRRTSLSALPRADWSRL